MVFDLGGVLIDWDPRYLYRQLLAEDEVDAFLDEIGFAAWNHAAGCRGQLVRRGGRAHVRPPPAPPRADRGLSAALSRHPRRPDPGTVAILEELHAAGVPLLALTNWSAETFQMARREFAFLDLFDGIVVSGEEQVAKPDPRIFRSCSTVTGLDAAHTVFIDDSPANITAAARRRSRHHPLREPRPAARAARRPGRSPRVATIMQSWFCWAEPHCMIRGSREVRHRRYADTR